jgi:ABC-type transport system, involved in lipoprotein release, permease component
MQKLLRKRVWRDLKTNLLRYLALGLLIVMGMYMVVSMVGAADTVIIGVNQKAKENLLEDGEFNVFVPLTQEEEKKLTDKGVTLEKMFCLDFIQKDGSSLRIFESRKKMNLISLEEGRLSEKKDEVVLEKRYCQVKGLHLGDSINIGSEMFQIVGIGTVPDYDAMYKTLSDSSVDSKQFGLAFLSERAYDKLNKSSLSSKSEELTYAYRLEGRMTSDELKSELENSKITANKINDPYFQEYWTEKVGKKEDMEKGIVELQTGTQGLEKALTELRNNSGGLKKGADLILHSYLEETSDGLRGYGLNKQLTEDNFEQLLGDLYANSENALFRIKLDSIQRQLLMLKEYKEGVVQYTDVVAGTADGSVKLSDGMDKLKDNSDEIMTSGFDVHLSNLTQFLKASDNPRIKASADDQVINKVAGLIAGIIAMILFTYVISVFVIHGIEKESSIIGALYALGVKKKELILHYLMLPVIVTFFAGAAGTMLGFSKWGVNFQMQDCYNYFSIPLLHTSYPPYLIIYGVIMPPVVAAIVNCFVIQKRLSQPVLKLIRNEPKNSKISNINLGNLGFISIFRIRQMLREARTGFTVLFGMFISLLIMMMGFDCYVLCKHVSTDYKADTKYAVMYTYKYPEENVPKAGEECFAKVLKREMYGYQLDVTLLGIHRDNPYFDADVKKGKNKIIISSAMAQKYQLSIGDKVILTDDEEGMDYAFTVEDIIQYATGLYAFMDIDSMRGLFGEKEDFYNVVFADQKLNIDSGRLYATTTKEDIGKSSDVFIAKMMPLIYMLLAVPAFIFCVVMYLMVKVMIDRSAFNISLIKIFGYRTGEIRKLYLNGNLYLIAIGAAICIPLDKKLMDAIYPFLISNVACGMNLTFSWQLYLGIYIFIIALYFIIDRLLVGQLKKLTPAEVLKNRE